MISFLYTTFFFSLLSFMYILQVYAMVLD